MSRADEMRQVIRYLTAEAFNMRDVEEEDPTLKALHIETAEALEHLVRLIQRLVDSGRYE